MLEYITTAMNNPSTSFLVGAAVMLLSIMVGIFIGNKLYAWKK